MTCLLHGVLQEIQLEKEQLALELATPAAEIAGLRGAIMRLSPCACFSAGAVSLRCHKRYKQRRNPVGRHPSPRFAVRGPPGEGCFRAPVARLSARAHRIVSDGTVATIFGIAQNATLTAALHALRVQSASELAEVQAQVGICYASAHAFMPFACARALMNGVCRSTVCALVISTHPSLSRSSKRWLRSRRKLSSCVARARSEYRCGGPGARARARADRELPGRHCVQAAQDAAAELRKQLDESNAADSAAVIERLTEQVA